MDELEKLKKEYIKTAAPKNWEQIAQMLPSQSHFDTKKALTRGSILFALVILVSGILIGNFKGKVSNSHNLAVKNGTGEIKTPQEATGSVEMPSENLENLQKSQQNEKETNQQSDKQPQQKKNNFWEMINDFYKRETAEVQSLKDQTDDNHNRRERQEDN